MNKAPLRIELEFVINSNLPLIDRPESVVICTFDLKPNLDWFSRQHLASSQTIDRNH